MPDLLFELEAAVDTAETPSVKATALQKLAEYLTDADPKRGVAVAHELGQAALALSDHALYINSLLSAAWAAHNLADYAGSLSQALEALKLARTQQSLDLEFDALNIIGTNHNVVGNRPDALSAFMDALKVAQAGDSALKIATVQNNIGLVYEGMGDYGDALNHYQQALAVYRQTTSHAILRSIAASNVAESHNRLRQFTQALEAAHEAAAAAASAGFSMGEGLALMQKGSAYAGLNCFADADRCFQQSRELLEKSDATYQHAALLQALADLRCRQGDTAACIEIFHQALLLFESIDAQPAIFPLHKSLAEAYASIDQYERAFHHMQQFHEVKERVFNEQADSREKTLQMMYEVDKARLEAENQRHRNLALQQEIEQNEQMIAELDSYADNVAHDLKNPISLIVSFADLIQTDPDNALSQSSQECLTNLQAAADKLKEIVDALLSLAKARKKEILPQPVDMTRVMQEALSRTKTLAQRFDATFEVPERLPNCMGNTVWLEEVLVNYTSNALKYGGAPPRVWIDSIVEDGGMITYRVRDNGHGLSIEEQAKLFNKFERLGQQKIDGTGIGLMIVKTVVEKLGGRVGVMSSGQSGEGSTFSFTLPSIAAN
jgi:signal transduction histidine kinase